MDMNDMMEEEGVPEAVSSVKTAFIKQEKQELNLGVLLGFGEDELDAAYGFACQKITRGELDQATGLLLMLVLLKPDRAKYWRALGLALHRNKVYGVAELMYTRALNIDPQDVIARSFRAEAYLWLNRKSAARRDAEQAIADAHVQNKRENAPYVKRAEAVMASIHEEDAVGEFVR